MIHFHSLEVNHFSFQEVIITHLLKAALAGCLELPDASIPTPPSENSNMIMATLTARTSPRERTPLYI